MEETSEPRSPKNDSSFDSIDESDDIAVEDSKLGIQTRLTVQIEKLPDWMIPLFQKISGSTSPNVDKKIGSKPIKKPGSTDQIKKSSEQNLENRNRKFNKMKKRSRCEYCGLLYLRLSTHCKAVHIKKNHTKNSSTSFDCNFCPRKFKKQTTLNAHLSRCHKSLVESLHHKCKLCKKLFLTSQGLSRHLKIHRAGKKSWPLSRKCLFCNKRFNGKRDFDRHERTHTGEKPYTCCLCQKSFVQMIHMKRHLYTHSRGVLLCEICGVTFSHKTTYSTHLKLHQRPIKQERSTVAVIEEEKENLEETGSYPEESFEDDQSSPNPNNIPDQETESGKRKYECMLCGERFSRGSDLRIHIRHHTGEEPYSCTSCEASFKSKFDLKNHKICHLRDPLTPV